MAEKEKRKTWPRRGKHLSCTAILLQNPDNALNINYLKERNIISPYCVRQKALIQKFNLKI